MRLSPVKDWRRWALSAALVALSGVAGCGRTGTVTGKVTYNGTALKGGNVVFYTADNRPFATEIAEDGTYTVEKVPAGPVKITVETESLRPAAGSRSYSPPPGSNSPADYKPPDHREMAKRYVAIPTRYAEASQSGLTYEVKSGKNDHPIDLK
jgi:hypothetical protein